MISKTWLVVIAVLLTVYPVLAANIRDYSPGDYMVKVDRMDTALSLNPDSVSYGAIDDEVRYQKRNAEYKYPNFYGPGWDLIYTDDGRMIKEEIVIRQKPTITEDLSFTFSILAENLTHSREPEALYFYKGITPLYKVLNPVALGEVSNLALEYDYSGGIYTITVPKTWLLEQKYPITIDPTIVYDLFYGDSINTDLWNCTYSNDAEGYANCSQQNNMLNVTMLTEPPAGPDGSAIVTLETVGLDLYERLFFTLYGNLTGKTADIAGTQFNTFEVRAIDPESDTVQCKISNTTAANTAFNLFTDYVNVSRTNRTHITVDYDGASGSTCDISGLDDPINLRFYHEVYSSAGGNAGGNITAFYINSTKSGRIRSSAEETYGDLLAFWAFDEYNASDGNRTPDAGTYRYDGVLQNTTESIPQIVSTPSSNGTLFDGTNFVDIDGIKGDISLDEPGSLEVLFNVSRVDIQYQTLMQCRADDGKRIGFVIEYDDISASIGAAVPLLNSTVAAVVGEWYHFIATWDGENVTMWVNGNNTANATYTSSASPFTTWGCNIGISASNTNPFNGTVDYFKVYDAALNSSQIAERNASRQLYAFSTVQQCENPDDQNVRVTVYNEQLTNETINSTLEVSGTTWTAGNPRNAFNISLGGSYQYDLCFMTDGNSTLYGDVYYKYTNPSGFTHRYYWVNRSFLSSGREILNLYNFNGTGGISDLKITLRDRSNYRYMPNIVVSLERYYVGTDTWRIVQMDESGDFGQIFFNIREEDTDYRLRFLDRPNVSYIEISNPMKFVCDATRCDLTWLLDALSATTITDNLTVSWSYLNDTGLIYVNWSDPTGEIQSIRDTISQETMTGQLIICDNTTNSPIGSDVCNISGRSGVIWIRIRSTMSGGNVSEYTDWLEVRPSALHTVVSQNEGAFWAAGIMITCLGMGLMSPVLAIIAMIAGLIFIYFLHILNAITLTFIIVATVAGIAIGLKLRS